MAIFSSGGHTCPAAKNADQVTNTADPIVGSVTFQNLILYICSGCLGLVGLTCLLNIFMHLSHYSDPKQQRQIIRVVFTPVVFCLFSVISVAEYSTAIYMVPIRDLYEVFAMASIFLLFIEWVAPDPSTRESYFANVENRKKRGSKFSKDKSYDVIPGGSLKFFKSKWSILFLSLVVDIIIFITQEASQAAGTYCLTSMKPYFAHLWVLVIGHSAIIVGVIAVLKTYKLLKPIPEFSSHRPLLKLASLKLIVFTNFIQTLVFSVLQGQGVLTGNHSITANDLQYGIPSLLVSVEQLIFAALMLYSFRSAEYKHQGKAMGFLPAVFHAMNPLDYIQGIVTGFKYLLTRSQSNSATAFRKSSQNGNYSSGEDTTLQPYKYDTEQPQQESQQYATPTQPPRSHAHGQPQEQYIPNYGGQGDYPVSGMADGYNGRSSAGGRRGGRRGHHGPIGMLVSAGMNAYQSSQQNKR